jgi:rRNA maturation protein Rpf1
MIIKNTQRVITTSKKPDKKILFLLKDLLQLIPDLIYYKRKKFKIRHIFQYLKKFKAKTIFVVKKNSRIILNLWQINIEKKISIKYEFLSILLKNIFNSKENSIHFNPEIILKNFKGKVEKMTAILLKSWFCKSPNFKKRQIVSFYFKKGLIFFNYFRYIFSSSGKDVKLQEIGPRFTLRFCKLYENCFF